MARRVGPGLGEAAEVMGPGTQRQECRLSLGRLWAAGGWGLGGWCWGRQGWRQVQGCDQGKLACSRGNSAKTIWGVGGLGSLAAHSLSECFSSEHLVPSGGLASWS